MTRSSASPFALKRSLRRFSLAAACAVALAGLVVGGGGAVEIPPNAPPLSAKALELKGLTLDEAMAMLTPDKKIRGYVDRLRANSGQISGWAVDGTAPGTPVSFLIYADGQLLAAVRPAWWRADIPNVPEGSLIAFSLYAPECPKGAPLRVFAVTDDGRQNELQWWNLDSFCP